MQSFASDLMEKPRGSRDGNSGSTGFLLDLSGKSRDELMEMKLEIDCEIDSIKTQLESAKVTKAVYGTYADPAWFRKATSALRIKGRQSQQIQMFLKKMKGERAIAFEKLFIEVAQDVLDKEMYLRLIDETNRRLDEIA